MTADNDTDSIRHHNERLTQMRAEAKDEALQQAQAEEQRAAHRAEQRTKSIAADELRVAGLPLSELTRDQLLDHIRKMRNEKPPEVPHDYYISPEQQARTEAEQQAGREAVARAEAEQAKYRQLQLKLDYEERAKEATNVSVHHPNPSQNEVFPTVKATLPGSGQVRKK